MWYTFWLYKVVFVSWWYNYGIHWNTLQFMLTEGHLRPTCCAPVHCVTAAVFRWCLLVRTAVLEYASASQIGITTLMIVHTQHTLSETRGYVKRIHPPSSHRHVWRHRGRSAVVGWKFYARRRRMLRVERRKIWVMIWERIMRKNLFQTEKKRGTVLWEFRLWKWLEFEDSRSDAGLLF